MLVGWLIYTVCLAGECRLLPYMQGLLILARAYTLPQSWYE